MIDTYAEFFVQNWPLFLALVAVLGFLIFDPAALSSTVARAVSPMELSRLVNHEQAVLIDVRNKDEFASRHIAKSRNFPLDEIESKSRLLDKFKKRPLVIICNTGVHSGKAAKQLRKLEFDKLFQLKGGLNEWQKENLPFEKSTTGKARISKQEIEKPKD